MQRANNPSLEQNIYQMSVLTDQGRFTHLWWINIIEAIMSLDLKEKCGIWPKMISPIHCTDYVHTGSAHPTTIVEKLRIEADAIF